MQPSGEVFLAAIIFCVHGAVTLSQIEEKDESCPGLNNLEGISSHIYVRHQSSHNNDDGIQFQFSQLDCPPATRADETSANNMAGSCQHFQDSRELSPINTADNDESPSQACTNPEPSATFVTALYDIGRGQWKIFPRPYSLYLQYFKDILKLNVRMVVLVEDHDTEFVWQTRIQSNLTNSTQVWAKPFSNLPLHQYLGRVRNVVESKEFKKDNENLRHPEGFSAEYIVLMNSKLAFLKEVAEANPFCTSHFVWIDAGYGHGKNVLSPEGVEWIPRDLIAVRDKITIIELEKPELYTPYEESVLFKMAARPAFSGGFFGGDSFAISRLTTFHEEIFETMLEKGIVHEDQMMMLLSYFRKPDYFNRVTGWWYDGYKLFH